MDSLQQYCAVFFLAFSWGAAVQAQSTDDDELALSLGDEEFISIATGQKQLISKAPSVASVITSEEIEAIGALDLDDALETVPGLHVSISAGNTPVYSVRGIHTVFNPQVLLLINGIPVTNVYHGNRGQAWGGMPVKNIARIEVIRGPGSAIYGADAYAGVINVITKTADQIDGTVLGARAGSFNTADSWLLHGGTLGEWDVAFSLQVHTTDGHEQIVESDAQTQNDARWGTSASLAPGPVNLGIDSLDTRLELSRQRWTFRMGYQGRRDMGTYAGVAEALDPEGRKESDRFNMDLTYYNPDLAEHWDFSAQTSYFDTSAKSDLFLFPPGTDFTAAGGGPFPDGVIGNPYVYERHYRLDISSFYRGIDNHDIRLGTGYYYIDMYRIKDTRNFIQNNFGVPVPIGEVVDVSDTAPFITEEDRTVYYLSTQDEWALAPDWKLTAGIRFDKYSDFGDTVNPRAALVWQTRYNMTTKLLFGRAFRAPSFAELFNINNPVALGNRNLDPETIDTVELATDLSPRPGLKLSMNIFTYTMEDVIRFEQDPAPATSRTTQNIGEQTGHGFELEAEWEISNRVSLIGNYAFQDSEDEYLGGNAPDAPRRQLYLRNDWKLTPDWSLHTQLNYVADRQRAAGDLREAVDDYTKVDLILRKRQANTNIGMALYLLNAFDEDIREPSPPPGLIRSDLPQAPRSFYGEVSYHW